MDISVVIPTHRRPDLLEAALLSVHRQLLRPHEVVVVDDANHPPTHKVVSDFAERSDIPIRYICNLHAPGVCGSRNLGAFLAKSEWLAFLDDDDLWEPDFLVHTVKRAQRHRVDLVMSGLRREEVGLPDSFRFTPEHMDGQSVLQFRSSMTGSNFIIRAEHFAAVRGFDPEIPVFNDWDLLIRLLRNGTCYAVVPEPLAIWRDHAGERIASPTLKRADGIDTFLKRYGTELPRAMRRELRTTALGIRRKCAARSLRYFELSVALAWAHGPAAAIARLQKAPRRFAAS